MKIKFSTVLLLFLILLSSCNNQLSKYSTTFTGAFHTTITIIGYAENEQAFTETANYIYDRLIYLNNLFDIYHNYSNLNNLKTINDHAGQQKVKVPDELFDLIKISKEAYEITGGKVNIAMGSVLEIWHDYRTRNENLLPEMDKLLEANKYTDIEKIILDEKEKTVYLSDPNMSIDAGAIAKGYAADLIIEELNQLGLTGYLLNLGGNIKSIGQPAYKDYWSIGVENPSLDHESKSVPMDTLYLNDTAVVSSGNYQRYYTVNDVNYNHIIDPDTLFPAEYFNQVTIICEDSTLGDILSTALFILPYEEGKQLLDSYDAEALWIFRDGNRACTENYQKLSNNFQ